MATATLRQLEERLPWYRSLSAEERSWVGLVAQTGLAQFIAWCAEDSSEPASVGLFQAAPRELTGSISLAHTLELVRTGVDVVEERAGELAQGEEVAALREKVLRYSRDIAFSAAVVYARAAEQRGAWDARLEAMVIDGLIRGQVDNALGSQMAALGWTEDHPLLVMVGTRPRGGTQEVLDHLHRQARARELNLVVGVHEDRLVMVLSAGTGDLQQHLDALATLFGDGPVVVGPTVPGLAQAVHSAQSALAGLRATAGWPGAPRPVYADELLPERALLGDHLARVLLISDIYQPLESAGGQELIGTVVAYMEAGREIAEAARLLFVHANTVRYRLKRVVEVTGLNPLVPRDGYVLHTAMVMGRLNHADFVESPQTLSTHLVQPGEDKAPASAAQ